MGIRNLGIRNQNYHHSKRGSLSLWEGRRPVAGEGREADKHRPVQVVISEKIVSIESGRFSHKPLLYEESILERRGIQEKRQVFKSGSRFLTNFLKAQRIKLKR